MAESYSTSPDALPKCPTGIHGLDEITGGGLPKGRPTLVCGGPGCGKTIFGMEFLVRGATQFGEPGVFVSFEESPGELIQNVSSFGWDLEKLEKEGAFLIEHVQVERSEIQETGEYDLEGLFIRLGSAVDSVGARRIVLDTVESLFASLPNELILRSELRRLFRWIKEKGLTAVVTGERGEKSLTRHGIEEYVSDCVLDLNVRISEDISTRRIRVVKYRGTPHGTNEYPFLIGRDGFSVMPITSLGLDYDVSTERVPTGVAQLDRMLGGRGYFKGSSVLVSGSAGTGKTSLAGAFAQSTCSLGEKCLFFAFEEPASQIVRNMGTLGIDMQQWVDRGLLRIHSSRPTTFGMEMHLLSMYNMVHDFQPRSVVIDPLSTMTEIGSEREVKAMLIRFVDFLKDKGITSFFTDLTSERTAGEYSRIAVSSLMDTWILLRNMESGGERNRALFVIKSRGMEHSNQVREFVLSSNGIELTDAYLGSEGMLMGSARVAQEARERADRHMREAELQRKRREFQTRRGEIEARMAALRLEIEATDEELSAMEAEAKNIADAETRDRDAMARIRKASEGKQS